MWNRCALVFVIGTLATVGVGCSSADTQDPTETPGENVDPGSGQKTALSSATIGPITAEPGGDETVCIHRRLDNPTEAWVRTLRGRLVDGSHHMIIYLSDETVENTEPVPCGGFSGLIDGDDTPVFIAQQKLEEVFLPIDKDDGRPVAYRIEPNQMLRMELHWFNTTPEPTEVTGVVEFETIPIDTDVWEAQFGFWGTLDIDIPARSELQTPVMFQEGMSETKVFAATTHQHQFGTEMNIWYADSTDVTDDNLIVHSENWEEPPLEFFDPPLLFDGTNGLAYQCTWNNTSGKEVSFGEGFNDEMCFLWAYYYPSKGFDLCVDFGCPTRDGFDFSGL